MSDSTAEEIFPALFDLLRKKQPITTKILFDLAEPLDIHWSELRADDLLLADGLAWKCTTGDCGLVNYRNGDAECEVCGGPRPDQKSPVVSGQ